MGNTACAPHNYSHALTDVPSWSLLVSVVFIVVFCAVAWFASPKGENQTVWRSTLVLSAWACWLMWGTFPTISLHLMDGRAGQCLQEGLDRR